MVGSGPCTIPRRDDNEGPTAKLETGEETRVTDQNDDPNREVTARISGAIYERMMCRGSK